MIQRKYKIRYHERCRAPNSKDGRIKNIVKTSRIKNSNRAQ
jgi:hypothetical protein